MHYTPLKGPVIAAMGVVWVGYGRGVVGGSNDLLGKWWQNLVALGGMEGGDARGLGDHRALERRSELLGERAGGGAGGRGQHALGGRGGGLCESLPDEAGTHDGGHCSGRGRAMQGGHDGEGQVGEVERSATRDIDMSTTMPRIWSADNAGR